ncbi:PREDICTED: hemocytin-like [Priapulus caudatus]|uniref:Hemocytin-like n=1 Tax=Priapulus caudatus TaxID=37621 RepID=A0ABM1E0Y1_PRICU|nr:PREDICTED: hemocytin-like [Priapulus caudatus]
MALTITGTWLCQALVCFSVISSGYGASDYMSQFSQYDGEQGDYPVGQGDYQSDYGHPGGMDILGNICEFPITPKNSRIECSTTGDNVKKRCKATCHDGYHFPTGETQLVSECNSYIGRWEPVSSFPDCEAVCDIDCLNDGKCQHNQCVCPAKFRGDRCQYPTSNCGTKTLGFIGHISCTHTQRESSCKVSCPQGYQFETPVTKTYVCDLEGTWNPPSVPRCLPTDSFLTSANDIVLGEAPSRYVGTCSSWGQTHYRTFDGRNFSFRGQCTYALAKDCVDSSFSIHVANDDNCSDTHRCKRIVKVYAAGIEVILQNNPITGFPGAYVNGKNIAIPVTVNGLLLEKTGGLIIMESDFGFRLRWDTKEAVFIDVTSALAHKTCGLCGVFDENRANDFTTIEGRVAASPLDFATSWKMNPAEDQCPNTENVENECSSVVARGDMSIALNAGTSCNRLRSTEYAACHDVLDPTFYIESCQRDTCKCGMERDDCFCFSFEAYFRECFRMNPSLAFTWRKTDLCPMDCSAGMEYNSCGTSCPRSCRGQVYDCEDDHCVEGCHCPSGSVLLDGRCVRQVECPCFYQGTDYPSGSTIDQDCNRCECAGGRWLCTAKKCEARCSVVGAHFTTFDGTKYSFRGSCTYYLIHNDTFSVELANPACEIGDISCVRHLTVRYNGNIIKLGDNRMVTVNGESVTQFPFQSLGSYVSATSSFTKVDLGVGLSILWDGRSIVYIDATENLIDQVAGLCGTFNFKNIDDFTTPEGHLEADAEAFATRWQKTSDCQVHEVLPSRDACDLYEQRRALADSTCSVLKSELFSACHRIVDVTDYFIDCRQDICRSKDQLKESLCPILALYASACANRGVILKWRNHVDTCALQCTGGQEYSECTSDCTATCSNIASNAVCSRHCVEGCECPEGEALDVNGHCIPIMTCPCTHSGKEYPAGADIDIQGSLCTCQAAQWRCANVGDSQVEDTSGTSSNLLRCGDFMEFTKCISNCPVTCRAYANAPECSTVVCRDGCQCIKGYVLDGDVCVRPSNCKCMHGGATYNRDDQIKIDCNSCVCQAGGVWSCTEQECYGVCHVYGESHYRSYDQKEFRMQGECTYVMAKSADGVAAEQAFRVTVENIECGSGGTTCSRTVIIQLGGKKVVLQRDRPVVAFRDDIVTVKEVGLYVIVQSNIGVSVEWDKGTSVYVRLSPRWKTRVNGLCGNYNGNAQDDFTTPAGGPPLALATEFADSWRVYEHCLPSKAIEDTCRLFPHRKAWAQRRCGVIASEVFSDCHSLVPPESYMDRCVFDSCACDTGGDCECLCTAIAAYARACSVAGLPIKWRTQELCRRRLFCQNRKIKCIGNPCTTTQATTTRTTTEPPVSTVIVTPDNSISECGWSQWSNTHRRTTIPTGGDVERIDEILASQPDYCPNGEIIDIACRITNTGIYANVSGQVVTCNLDEGLACKNSDQKFGKPCYDFEAQVFCDCNPRTTTKPPTTTKKVPGWTTIDTSGITCTPGWTAWLNFSSPYTKPGFQEREGVEEIRKHFKFCSEDEVEIVQCRDAVTKLNYLDTDDIGVTCEKNGVSCLNLQQQDGLCSDYEIRFFCKCSTDTCESPLNIASQFATDTTLSSSSLKRRSQLSYIEVNNTKGAWSPAVDDRQQWIQVSFENVMTIKGILVQGSPVADEWVTKYLVQFSVDGSNFQYVSVSGVAPQIFEANFDRDTIVTNTFLLDIGAAHIRIVPVEWNGGISMRAELIGCNNNNDMTTLRPPVTVTTELEKEPTSTLSPECVDGWTQWMDSDTPFDNQPFERQIGVGDNELISQLRLEYAFCELPIDVECRTRDDQVPSDLTREQVTCDADTGFSCLNNQQYDNECENYEVRFFCQCNPPLTRPSTTLSPTTTTSGSNIVSCLKHGWSEWMNSNDAEVHPLGDIEDINKLRQQFPLCQVENMEDIQCRVAGTKISHLVSGYNVRCDVLLGLRCINEEQVFGPRCPDFEISVYCNCLETTLVTRETLTTTEGTSTLTKTTYSTQTRRTTQSTVTSQTTTANTPPLTCASSMNVRDDGEIRDDQITASTSKKNYPPHLGRLDGRTGWRPRVKDDQQYIEVRFDQRTMITGVETQGHATFDEWVTGYQVSYSVTGLEPFIYYRESADLTPKVFSANDDQNTGVTNWFNREIAVRAVRLHPLTWKKGIGLRMELYGCIVATPGTTTARPISTLTTRRTLRPQRTTATTERPSVCELPMNINDTTVVRDNQMLASTEEDLYPAYDGRLNSPSGWVPRIHNSNQYIEVRLNEPTEISGVVTQGHKELPYWVTNYRVSYSVDGRDTSYYSDSPDGNPKVFTANTDQETPVTNLFTRDILIRVLRIHPVTWKDAIGMRFELVGCNPLEANIIYSTNRPVETATTRRTFRPKTTTAATERPSVCEYPMNIDDNAVVRDNQIIATTEEALNPAYDGRLNSPSGWVPRIQDVNQYIEVRLPEPTEISGVVTQGHNERPYWVTNYRVSYSVDGRAPFTYYSDSPDGNPTVFTANTDQDTPVTNLFTRDIPIRVVRIHPVTWNDGIGMRFELLGCYPLEVSTVYTTSPPVETVTTRRTFRPRSTTATTERPTVCEYPMNIDDNAVVRDNQIIATTEEALNPAYDGRLNSLSGWVPRIQDVNQYIEVRLHEPTEISGVVTQGHNERPYWVTNYRVSYSVDGRAPFTYYSDSPDGNPTVFTANTDQDTPVTNLFTRDIPIRVLRIHPVTWNNGIGMRFELLGCYPLEVSTVYTTSRPVETVTTRRTFRPRTTTATTERPLVCEQPMNIDDNAVVKDNQIIATTEEALNPAYEGRLNSLSGWVPRKQDLKQYIEVRLREPTEISGVVTQGHNELPYWVTNYRVSYSVDGREPFTYYSDSPDQNPKVFTANTDQHTPVTNMFTRDIPIRVLRIHPVDWFNEISLRFELLGCQPLVASTIFTTRTPTSTVTTRRTARPRTTTAAVCPPGLVYDECPYRCNQRCHYFYQTSEECRQYGSTECVPGCVPDCQPPNVWRDEQTCVASKECTCRMLDGSVAAPGKVWFDGVCEECRCWNNTLECYTRKQCHNVTVEPQIKCNDTLITLDTKTTSTSSQEEIGFTHSDNGEGVQWIAEIDDTRQYLIIELEAEDSIRSLITQGRPYESIAFSGGQVTSFYLMHSTDGSNWEEYMENGRPKLFEADTKHPDIPVTHTLMSSRGEFLIAKYLMIRPATWNNHIAIRAYVIGCYEAIATTVTTPVTESTPQQVPTKSGCEFETPYVNLQHPSAATTGDYELVFDVASAAGFCEFPIGILCRDSVTKLFYDETGEVVTCDLEIGLVCNDNDQIPGKYCSDYEVSIRCPICGPQLCPFVTDDSSCPRNCPPGYVCDGRSCIDPIDCACVVEGKRFKAGDIIVNTNCESCSCFRGRASCVPTECPVCVRDQVEYFSEDCECSCVCPPNLIECPANGKCIRPEYWCDGTQDCDQNEDEIDCPVESTTSPSPPTTSAPTTTVGPQPLPPTCTVIRNNFKTFDGVNYSYEICDHILMEQLDNTAFSVSVRLLCPQDSNSRSDCVSQLTVEIDSTVILVRPDLSVLVNELYYTPDELQLLRIPHVVIKHVGNQIIVRSLTYGFSVQWDASMEATIKILDKRQLIGKVAGLCGFYNDEKRDDFMKPDGTRSLSVKQFGDSWGSQIGCIPQPKCTDVINAITRSTCDALRGAPFSDCHNYVSPEVFIRVCEEEMCDCLATLNNVSKIVAEQCKCIAFEKYARACAIEAALDIEWRTLHMCEPTECPTNEVWSDCGPGCERTCDNWNEENIVCDLSCVPGCYCKPGLVRKGSTCVPRDTCLDCICIAYGDPHYYSFDNTYFFFNGNCTYVLARDTENLDFEVLAVNEQCEEQPETTCTVGTIVNYQGHTAEIYRGPLVLFDGVQLLESNLPHTAYGITVKHVGIHYIIEIPDIELDVRYTEENFGVQVKVPSTIYFNKTEGLCGPCNHNRSDDLLTSDGVITTDSDEFGYSWLVDPNDPTVNCEVKPTPECDYGNPTTMCDAIWNENFRRCHAIVDPNLYYESCLIDVKCTQDPSALNSTSCSALSIYAGICALSGICLDWRTDDICPINCEGELQYQECGSVCEMTCANYEHFNPEICKSPPVSGCFCPPGLIDVDGQCKEIGSCEEPCDSEGHIVGDEWRVNECTVCMCTESGKACTHEFCPPPPSCSDSERLNKYELPGKCCAEYNCECDDRKCPPEVLPICPFDQIQSVVALNQCCTSVVCVCPDEATCRESVVPTIEEGEQIIIDDRYCCETYSKICNESQCDSAPFCGESKQLIPNKPADKCCPSYECLCNPNTCPPIVVPKCEFDQVPVEVVNAGGCCRYFECKCSPDAMCPLPETPELDIGEVLQRDNNYCCETYIKVCVPDQCPAPPVCTGGFVLEQQKIPDKCCETYNCVYPANKCLYNETVVGRDRVVEYEPNETWNDGLCKHCQCVKRQPGPADNFYDPVCEIEKCPKITEEYEPVETHGKCCPDVVKMRCKFNEHVYLEHETWPSPDGDPCKLYSCQPNPDGTGVYALLSVTSCKTDCKRSEIYVPPRPERNICCGECIRDKCEDNGKLYEVGETWTSPESECVINECRRNGEVRQQYKECSPPQCPREQQILDSSGCCYECTDIPIITNPPSTCEPRPVVGKEVRFVVRAEGGTTCRNQRPVYGMKECGGTCDSSSTFNTMINDFESDCKCCTVTKEESAEVVLQCDNGHEIVHTYRQPVACACTVCSLSGGDSGFDLPTVVPVK